MKYCLLVVLFVSCAGSKSNRWDKVSYENETYLNTIGENERRLHKPEPAEDSDIVLRDTSYHQSKIKTSAVVYFKISKRDKEHFVANLSKNNCRVYLPKSDTLVIRIGDDFVGVGGFGFIIKYNKGKFYSVPYKHSDCHIAYEPNPTYKIQQQELVLDKEKYNMGDSIYGKIYFHISETLDYRKFNKDGITKTEHYASGYFRAIVKKDLYW